MTTLQVNAKDRTYPVVIGNKALPSLGGWLDKSNPTAIFVITDEIIWKLHGEKVKKYLPESAHIVFIPPGEEGKRLDIYSNLMDQAITFGLDRKSVAIAFGGGAVGDVTGFFASTYMRGISFIQVPTTILAHDSAIGGKVAVNHPLAKNSIGSFYPPDGVYYDTIFLQSLPKRERLSGFGEVMKHGWISSPEFLNKIKKQIPSLEALMESDMSELLLEGMVVKKAIVEKDEFESGTRAYLNFGHTLGHAIENVAKYGSISHGEAITIGMTYALLLSELNDSKNPFTIHSYISYLKELGYVGDILLTLPFDSLWNAMKRDKKNQSQKPNFVLLSSIGQPKMQEVSYEKAKAAFHYLCTLWTGKGMMMQ
ncbi:3-dehydroquinate synthase [Mangrovibacillus cuniculi]|uniref:3-dehydroquinate synthase n=1 Tax=Mangrovibacillus cuniculi TaxID=2593652 RepID=A0A7S8CB21_9BACI|nr:3-dehydroquinate synthase [Mangrovibacillus cuniculi]QPC46696.1 3-dehydroquinate synthase [Mangrovibacillus cuniculi]